VVWRVSDSNDISTDKRLICPSIGATLFPYFSTIAPIEYPFIAIMRVFPLTVFTTNSKHYTRIDSRINHHTKLRILFRIKFYVSNRLGIFPSLHLFHYCFIVMLKLKVFGEFVGPVKTP
jgi:hypothetical protein